MLFKTLTILTAALSVSAATVTTHMHQRRVALDIFGPRGGDQWAAGSQQWLFWAPTVCAKGSVLLIGDSSTHLLVPDLRLTLGQFKVDVPGSTTPGDYVVQIISDGDISNSGVVHVVPSGTPPPPPPPPAPTCEL